MRHSFYLRVDLFDVIGGDVIRWRNNRSPFIGTTSFLPITLGDLPTSNCSRYIKTTVISRKNVLASFIPYTRKFLNFLKVNVATTMSIATLPSKTLAIIVSVTITGSCFQTNASVDVSFISMPEAKSFLSICSTIRLFSTALEWQFLLFVGNSGLFFPRITKILKTCMVVLFVFFSSIKFGTFCVIKTCWVCCRIGHVPYFYGIY